MLQHDPKEVNFKAVKHTSPQQTGKKLVICGFNTSLNKANIEVAIHTAKRLNN